MLGLRRRGETFEIDPCVPTAWPSFSITWRYKSATYDITVLNPQHQCRGVASAEIDGAPADARALPLHDDNQTHRVQVVLGPGLSS